MLKISVSDLKTWLHSDLRRRDKLLLILASFDSPCQIKDMKERARDAGFNLGTKWNISSYLSRSKGLAIKTREGWEISDRGKQHLRELGVTKINPVANQVATDLRAIIQDIKDEKTRSFAEEAIKCYEFGLYRSAVVMSWVGAMAILYNHIHTNHLKDFNAEAKRVNSRWKTAKTTDDLSTMKEADFLDRIATLSIIGKNVKEELKKGLTLRNGCSHPNSLEIRSNAVAAHIEVLLLNVFKKFQ